MVLAAIIMMCSVAVFLWLYSVFSWQYPDTQLSREYAYYYEGNIFIDRGIGTKEVKIEVIPESEMLNTYAVLFNMCKDRILCYQSDSGRLFYIDPKTKNIQHIAKLRPGGDYRGMVTDCKTVFIYGENCLKYDLRTNTSSAQKDIKELRINPSGDGTAVVRKLDGSIWLSNIYQESYKERLLFKSSQYMRWDYDFRHHVLYTCKSRNGVIEAHDLSGRKTTIKLPSRFYALNVKYMPEYEELWASGHRTASAFTQLIIYDKNGKLLGKMEVSPSSSSQWQSVR